MKSKMRKGQRSWENKNKQIRFPEAVTISLG